MKIAVTYENEMVFQHFGHTLAFKIYEVEDGKIVKSYVEETNGSGHSALAGMLKGLGVDVLICGGIGMGAKVALIEADIRLFGGVSGNCDEVVEAYLSNTLMYNPDVKCDHHHEHGEGHTCGSHGCAGHNCH